MILRQNRNSPNGSITKSVNMPVELADQTTREAERAGHHNFSAVVVLALREFFARQTKDKEAA